MDEEATAVDAGSPASMPGDGGQHVGDEQQQQKPPKSILKKRKQPADVDVVEPAKPKREPRRQTAAPDKESAVPAVVVDAHFFAGLSSTLKHLHRETRAAKIASLAIV
jgi:hypothetical protein